MILHVPRDNNNIPLVRVRYMYNALNIFDFEEAYKFSLLSFIHFLLYERNDIFIKYFNSLLPHHSYNTRDFRMRLPPIRLTTERNFTIFKICNLMNNLPDNLLYPQFKNTLKKNFKIYLQSQ